MLCECQLSKTSLSDLQLVPQIITSIQRQSYYAQNVHVHLNLAPCNQAQRSQVFPKPFRLPTQSLTWWRPATSMQPSPSKRQTFWSGRPWGERASLYLHGGILSTQIPCTQVGASASRHSACAPFPTAVSISERRVLGCPYECVDL